MRFRFRPLSGRSSKRKDLRRVARGGARSAGVAGGSGKMLRSDGDGGGGDGEASDVDARREFEASVRKRVRSLACVEFVLVKRGLDTFVAVRELARAMGNAAVFSSKIKTAGVKDKRAVTAQKCAAVGVDPNLLLRVNSDPQWAGKLRVGNLRYTGKPVCVGDLQGNMFSLVVRNVRRRMLTHMPEVATALARDGFLNYYGEQRFGTGVKGGHSVGRFMLQGRFAAAMRVLLNCPPEPVADVEPQALRSPLRTHPAFLCFARTGDVSGALQEISRNPHAGRCDVLRKWLIAVSRTTDRDPEVRYQTAFGKMLTFQERTFYIHAYSSLLFNAALSLRVSLNSERAIEGDLVEVAGRLPHAWTTTATTGGAEHGDGSGGVGVGGGDEAGSSAPGLWRGAASSRVRHVTAEDVEANRYTLADVILPVLGHLSVVPKNEVGDFMMAVLEADGLSLESFRQLRANKLSIAAPGSYRTIVARPIDFSWNWVIDDDDDGDNGMSGDGGSGELAAVRAEGRPAAQRPGGPDGIAAFVADAISLKAPSTAEVAALGSTAADSGAEDCSRVALRVAFGLRSGQYATMIAREIFQAPLSVGTTPSEAARELQQ